MSLLQATAFSVNTIYAQVVTKVGPQAVVDVAHRMGIQSPLEPVCSITLGPGGRLAAGDDRRLRDARRPRHPPRAELAGCGDRARRRARARRLGAPGRPRAVAERRRPGDLRAHRRDPRRHRHGREHRPPGGRQDRHRGGLQGRLVLRLRPPARDVRLGRLPAGRDPARSHRRLRAGRRRLGPGAGSGTTSWPGRSTGPRSSRSPRRPAASCARRVPPARSPV